jgi:hypothetical protein
MRRTVLHKINDVIAQLEKQVKTNAAADEEDEKASYKILLNND